MQSRHATEVQQLMLFSKAIGRASFDIQQFPPGEHTDAGSITAPAVDWVTLAKLRVRSLMHLRVVTRLI